MIDDTRGVRSHLSSRGRARLAQAALGLTSAQARRAFAQAIVRDDMLDDRDIDAVVAEKKAIIRESQALEFYPASETPADVGGLDSLKKWLALREGAFTEEAAAYGLPAPKGLALIGIPGTGKSLTAKMIGGLWRLPLLRLDIGALFGSLVGESEERVRRALQLAETVAPCVLWTDEIEKGLSGGGLDGGTSQRVFGTILTWMQEKTAPVFVVATANDVSSLPPETMRRGRFDEIFFLDLPTEPERREIIAVHLRKRRRDPGTFDVAQLARISDGFTGAELEQTIVDSMYHGIRAGRGRPDRRRRRGDHPGSTAEQVAREVIERLRSWLHEGRAQSASFAEAGQAEQAQVRLELGRGDARAIDAVWRMWKLRPDDEVWTAMQGWHDPQGMVQDAVRAAKRLEGWHPPSDRDRDLFQRLVTADPDLVDTLIAASAVTEIAGAWPAQLSIAPDSSQIAIGTSAENTVYELPSGRIVARYPGRGHWTMLLLGDSVVVGNAEAHPRRMVYFSPDGTSRELKKEEAGKFLGRIPGGFMLGHYWGLSLWTADGRISRWVSGDDLSLGRYPTMSVLATEPRTGRFIVNILNGLVAELIMYDLDLTILGRVRREEHGDGLFCGPDRFVTWNYSRGDRMIRLFRRENDDLVLAAQTGPGEVLSAWPQHSLLVVKQSDSMVFLDADTLGEVQPPQRFPLTEPSKVSISDDGTVAAIVPSGTCDVAVHDLRLLRIADLADIPLADTRPEDVRVLDALTSGASNPPAVEVIRACFEYRYGSEIALGTGYTRHRADDIALGGSA